MVMKARKFFSTVKLAYKPEEVARITLNNPEGHNVFSEEFIASLHSNLDQVAANKEVKVVLIDSLGKNFSAGADFNYMKKLGSQSENLNVADAMNLSDLFMKIFQLNVPTVCSIQGSSFGGALGLIAACDIAVAEENAKFCFSETKLGLIPATISPFVVNKIGFSRANALFLTAEVFDATEAKAAGLIHKICADNTLEETTSQVIKNLLKNGPNAVRASKSLVKKVLIEQNMFSKEARENTAKQLASIRAGEEAKERLSAFLEKRKPRL